MRSGGFFVGAVGGLALALLVVGVGLVPAPDKQPAEHGVDAARERAVGDDRGPIGLTLPRRPTEAPNSIAGVARGTNRRDQRARCPPRPRRPRQPVPALHPSYRARATRLTAAGAAGRHAEAELAARRASWGERREPDCDGLAAARRAAGRGAGLRRLRQAAGLFVLTSSQETIV